MVLKKEITFSEASAIKNKNSVSHTKKILHFGVLKSEIFSRIFFKKQKNSASIVKLMFKNHFRPHKVLVNNMWVVVSLKY